MANASPRTWPTETAYVLDVPDDVGEQLHAWLDGADADVHVDIGDNNSATLSVNGEHLPAAFAALPTVVESHKSLDDVNFYKAGEVGCVLVARRGKDELPRTAELASGLTPPASNIRKNLWRKRPSRDPKEVEQVAVELEALRGGSLKPEFELLKVEEARWVQEDDPTAPRPMDVDVEPAAAAAPAPPSLKFTLPLAKPAAGKRGGGGRGSGGARGGGGSGGGGSAGAPTLMLKLPGAAASKAAAPPPQSASAAGPSSFSSSSAAMTGGRPQHPGTTPQAPPRVSAEEAQRKRAELAQLDGELARFQQMLRTLTNPLQRQQLQAKLAETNRKREEVLRALGGGA
jgi:hypothetical protein